RMGELLGRPERAAALIAAFDRTIAELHDRGAGGTAPLAVVYHVGDRAEGRGTIADDVLAAAGWRNLAAELGIEETGALPLETVLMHRPDVVLVGAAEAAWSTPAQQNLAHPAIEAAFGQGTRLAVLPDRFIVCGSTSVTEVVRRLVDERRRLAGEPRVVR
ncbi:MAG: ABC transporter substrate-binding protein, partial [Phyllobacteriaceae bacterium]|nr:ABC transporter substrate-binding protein [Phyllobacteriaceae bacterium]